MSAITSRADDRSIDYGALQTIEENLRALSETIDIVMENDDATTDEKVRALARAIRGELDGLKAFANDLEMNHG